MNAAGEIVSAKLKRWVVWTPAARKLHGQRVHRGRRRASKIRGGVS